MATDVGNFRSLSFESQRTSSRALPPIIGLVAGLTGMGRAHASRCPHAARSLDSELPEASKWGVNTQIKGLHEAAQRLRSALVGELRNLGAQCFSKSRWWQAPALLVEQGKSLRGEPSRRLTDRAPNPSDRPHASRQEIEPRTVAYVLADNWSCRSLGDRAFLAGPASLIRRAQVKPIWRSLGEEQAAIVRIVEGRSDSASMHT